MKRLVIFKFPFESCLGGSELQMMEVCTYLLQKKVDVVIYTHCQAFTKLCEEHHIPHQYYWFPQEPVSILSILTFPVKIPFALITTFFLLMQEKWKHKNSVFLCCNLSEKLLVGFWSVLFGAKTFFLETTSIQRWLTKNPLRFWYRLCTIWTSVICVSQHVKQELVTMGIKESRIHIIYPGVDIKKFTPALQKQTGIFTVGCVARLEKEKGIDILLQAIKKVSLYLPHLRVTIIGEGSQREELTWLTKQLQLQSIVTFVGHRPDVQEWMKHFSLFILPSKLRESFGIAAAEAMACGIPVIASDLGGIPELVEDGVTGVLVQTNSAAELSNQILLLAHDEDLRVKLADAARRRIEDSFSLPSMLSRYETALFD